MSTVSESELGLVVKSRALRRLLIHRTDAGRFRVSVTLNNQEGELDLVTTRKKPREWASLDRLAQHIQEKFGANLAITLCLQSGETSK
jgi:hypothetical protein